MNYIKINRICPTTRIIRVMNLDLWINKLKGLFSISIDEEVKHDADISDEEELPTQNQSNIHISTNSDEESSSREVEILKGTTDIGYKMFSDNIELDSFTIPNHIDIINSYAFWNCKNLTSISIPHGVSKIGEGAFSGCVRLTSITLPDSILEIGYNSFWNCWKLASITLSNKLTEIKAGVLRNCYKLTYVNIPNSVTHIGKNAFNHCEKLSSIIIPNKVLCIDEFAFWSCESLVAITLSSSLEKIDTYAFGNCDALFEIHSKNKIPPSIKDNTFGKKNYIGCKLFVPVGAYKDYRQAMGWCEFKQIIEE